MADLKAKDRKSMGAEEFAVPGKRKLPIHDAAHVKLAWGMVDRTKGLTSSERATARRKILAAAKEHGVDTADWTKGEMTDMVVSPVEVLTDAVEGQDGLMVARFRATRVNVVNENNRLYPDSVMTDAVERAVANYVTPGRMIGESPHPKPLKAASGNVVFDTRLENSVIKITHLFKEGAEVFLDAEVLETAKGKDLKALIKQGVSPGISMRALGDSVQRNINGVTVDVATFLDIRSFDVVMNPATDGCGAVEVLTDSQLEQIIEDGIEIVNPSCPVCGAQLQGQKPDADDDIDFYTCPAGHGPFVQDVYMRQEISAGHTLVLVTPDNWDRYSLAREWINGQANKMTDSVNEGTGEIMNHEDLVKAMKEDPSVRAAMTELAGAVAKPALDAVEAQKGADAKAQARSEAKAFLDERMATLQGRFDEKALKFIADSIGEPESKESAEGRFEAVVKMAGAIGAKAFTDAVGFDPANAGQQGHVRVEVGEGPRPWRPIVDAICKEIDAYSEQLGHQIDPKLRVVNRKAFEKVLDRAEETIGLRHLTDSVQNGQLKIFSDSQGAQLISDAVSVTTQQLLNQPTILTAVIVQAFQDVESAQFMYTDVFKGSEWRLPVETFTSAAAYNPSTGLMDLVVAEGIGIGASAINLGWQSFSPSWRRNAVSLTTDVIRALETGPASYAAIARAIYHISEDKKRKLDNAAYLEMIMAADEYNPLVVTNETPATAGAVTAAGLPAGTNAGYLYKLAPGIAGASAGYNPVVRPRTVNQIQPSGQIQALTTNPVSVKVGGAALVLGVWDGTNIVSFQGTTAQAAIDFEHGILYVMPTGGTGGSGVNPAAGTPVLPVVSYSAVTNYDRWHTTMGTGYTDIAAWYDTFLQQLTATSALMGSSPRFKKPNLGLFSLNAATYIENARIFYKWASPDGTRLIDTGNTFGQRSGMNLSRINAPWVAGDGRCLLTQKGSTRYGIETPYQMEGPFPVYDANQNPIDAKLWYGRENSVLCTPQVRDSNFNIINPVSRTIIIEP